MYIDMCIYMERERKKERKRDVCVCACVCVSNHVYNQEYVTSISAKQQASLHLKHLLTRFGQQPHHVHGQHPHHATRIGRKDREWESFLVTKKVTTWLNHENGILNSWLR